MNESFHLDGMNVADAGLKELVLRRKVTAELYKLLVYEWLLLLAEGSLDHHGKMFLV